jgi:hypothetical protein
MHEVTDIDKLTDEEREILDYMLAQEDGVGITIEPRADDSPVPLSFNQQRIWFIEKMDPGKATYVIPFAYRIRGSIDAAALEKSLYTIIQRHESLRTRYLEIDGKASQIVDPDPQF